MTEDDRLRIQHLLEVGRNSVCRNPVDEGTFAEL